MYLTTSSIVQEPSKFAVMNFGKRDDSWSENVATIKHGKAADINHSIRYTRWFLRFLGIWPFVISEPTRFDRNMATIVLPVSIIFMILLTIHLIAYMSRHMDDLAQFLMLLGPVILQISNMIKEYLILFHSQSIRFCLKHMERDWDRLENVNDRDIMMRNVRFGNNVTKLCAFCAYSSTLWYHTIKPLCEGTTINESNVTMRPLAYPGTDVYFDLQAKYVYEMIFIYFNAAAFLHFTVATTICNIAAVLVSHACGQIQILISRIETLVDPENIVNDVDVNESRVKYIVKNHVRLLGFTATVEQILNKIFLTEVTAVTLIICYLLYYCIMEWNNSDGGSLLMYILLLFSFTFNLLIFCQVGEKLKDQCEAVGKAAYLIEWYRLPRKTNLSLLMIMGTSNRPPQLTAGGMMELSIASFAVILKTSLAYLNMLRTMI